MLLMGFEREIYSINKYIAPNIQRIMLSATLIKNVQNVSKYLLNNPVKIEYMQNNNIISDRLKQVAINVKDKMKNECTLRILKRCKYTNSIVFCNTKKKTLEASKYLTFRLIALPPFFLYYFSFHNYFCNNYCTCNNY